MLAIKGADENCDRVLSVTPFIKEEIQPITQAVLPAAAAPVSPFVSAAGEALLATGRDVDATFAREATSPLVLRL
jgi:hypothetical protein